MRLVPRSLRGRLTLVFTVGAAIVLALCLALLYISLDRQLSSALDQDLSTRSGDLSAALQAGGDSAVVARDPLAQLYAADGALVASSPSLGERRLLSADDVTHLQRETPETRSVQLHDDAVPMQVRLLPRRLESGQVLVVGVSGEPLRAARERLVAVLVLAAPILIGILAMAGWLVVRAALRPVDILTREAAAISSVETDRRLPTVPGDDEIARLARTLEGMLDRLRVAFARERAFVDDASHELRSPIAVLRGEIELALSALDEPDEVERSLVSALSEAERLSRLAEDLLLLARERSGSLVVRQEPVDLMDLADSESRRLESLLGLRIEIRGDHAVVLGDSDQLRQVLVNLLHNSAAADAGTVQVRVTASTSTATIEVADDGPGFPPAVLDSALERFVRGDAARTRGISGAGLGLAIVRAIVTAHGGTVEARNDSPLGGAAVTVTLPLS